MEERGHDYFVQITDARPDTGGLSGATPSEAVSWGKVDPDELPNTIVCYTDSTIALPILTAYVINQSPARPLKRLYDRRDEMLEALRLDYMAAKLHQPEQATIDVAQFAQAATRPQTYPCGTPIRTR